MEGTKKLAPVICTAKSYLASAKSMQNLHLEPNKSMITGVGSKNFAKYEVIVQNQKLEQELKMIEWRSKTELPIVKILFYKIMQRKLLNQCSVLQVAIESFPCNLNSLPKMPLYQLLYLLKESLIGFERLYDRFGAFDITNKMVLINKHSKCKVWINENITLNFPSRKTKLTESEFLGKILKLFEDKCIKSALSNAFFDEIFRSNRILDATKYLQIFVKYHKMVMPNKLNALTESLGSKKLIERHEMNLEKVQECLHMKETFKKAPKFLTQIRDAEKSPLNKSADSPKNQMPFLKVRDLSQRKTFKDVSKKEEGWNEKSNMTPNSPISVQNNKETKSNGDATEFKFDMSPQADRKSEQCFDRFKRAELNFQIKTENLIRINEQSEEVKEDLYLTKMPEKQVPKFRKLSNNCLEHFPISCHESFKNIFRQKKESKVQCSQLTAATLDEYKKKGRFFEQRHFTLPAQVPEVNSLQNSESVKVKMAENTIFSQNNWIKRMNSLTGQNARDTITSLHDGVDTFSEQIARAAQKLQLLDRLGKQLKESFVDG